MRPVDSVDSRIQHEASANARGEMLHQQIVAVCQTRRRIVGIAAPLARDGLHARIRGNRGVESLDQHARHRSVAASHALQKFVDAYVGGVEIDAIENPLRSLPNLGRTSQVDRRRSALAQKGRHRGRMAMHEFGTQFDREIAVRRASRVGSSPIRSRASSTSTSTPSCVSLRAAARPAAPPPMTATVVDRVRA